MSTGIAADLRSIAEAAVMAPSADNQHCFELRARDDRILLSGSEAYVGAPFHKKLLSLISFGAVVENMTIRATRLGYQTSVLWLPDPLRQPLIAELRLARGVPTETPLDDAIARRHTNRRIRFGGPPLSESERSQFQHLLLPIDGVTLDFFDHGRQRSELLHLIRIAEAERFNSQALHADLFSAVRFDVGWHASADVGLPPAALAVEPGARWAFTQLRRWPVMNGLRRFGVQHALGFRAGYLPCRLAPQLCVLSTSLPLDQGAPAVGRALERFWLEAETRGLALQPFAGSALLALKEYPDVPPATSEALRRGWKHLVDAQPLMVFRLGKARRPLIRTSRQAPEHYLRD